MKITLELTDTIFRLAKCKAAEQGISLRQLVAEAVEDKLNAKPAVAARPWMKHMGMLRNLRGETRRIDRLIEQAFE